jgi:hypothetical protein
MTSRDFDAKSTTREGGSCGMFANILPNAAADGAEAVAVGARIRYDRPVPRIAAFAAFAGFVARMITGCPQ